MKIVLKKKAYNMTLEFVKANDMLKLSSDNPLNKRLAEFDSKYEEIYNHLKSKYS